MNEKNQEQFDELKSEEVITLIDEESGIPRSFYIIDVFDSEGSRYAALQSLEDDYDDEELPDEDFEDEEYFEEGEMILLRLDETDDGEVLVGIEDDAEFERVIKIFEARLEGED
jgi:hypothetical protein